MGNKEKSLNKIKKLLSLARKITNASETANAMSLGQNLMHAHKLTAQDIALMGLARPAVNVCHPMPLKFRAICRCLSGLFAAHLGFKAIYLGK